VSNNGCESEFIVVPYDDKYSAQYLEHYKTMIEEPETPQNPVNRSYIRNMQDKVTYFTLLAIDKNEKVLGVVKVSYHRSHQKNKYQIDALNKCAWGMNRILGNDTINYLGLKEDKVIPLLSNCMFLHLTTVIPESRAMGISVILKYMMFRIIYEARNYLAITHILSYSLNAASIHVSRNKFHGKVYEGGLERDGNDVNNVKDLLNLLGTILNVKEHFDTVINVNDPTFFKGLNVIDEQIHNCTLKHQKKEENRPKRERQEGEEEEEGPAHKKQRQGIKMVINIDGFI